MSSVPLFGGGAKKKSNARKRPRPQPSKKNPATFSSSSSSSSLSSLSSSKKLARATTKAATGAAAAAAARPPNAATKSPPSVRSPLDDDDATSTRGAAAAAALTPPMWCDAATESPTENVMTTTTTTTTSLETAGEWSMAANETPLALHDGTATAASPLPTATLTPTTNEDTTETTTTTTRRTTNDDDDADDTTERAQAEATMTTGNTKKRPGRTIRGPGAATALRKPTTKGIAIGAGLSVAPTPVVEEEEATMLHENVGQEETPVWTPQQQQQEVDWIPYLHWGKLDPAWNIPQKEENDTTVKRLKDFCTKYKDPEEEERKKERRAADRARRQEEEQQQQQQQQRQAALAAAPTAATAAAAVTGAPLDAPADDGAAEPNLEAQATATTARSAKDKKKKNNSGSGPLLQVRDGELVIDETSMVVGGRIDTEDVDKEFASEVEETGGSLTAMDWSFDSKRDKAKRWTVEETRLFYTALRQCGTDFTTMIVFLPGRSRNQLKLKYRRESRINAKLIDLALHPMKQLPMDLSVFGPELKVDENSPVMSRAQVAEAAAAAAAAAEKEALLNDDDDKKKKKQKKRGRKNKTEEGDADADDDDDDDYFTEEVDETENEPSAPSTRKRKEEEERAPAKKKKKKEEEEEEYLNALFGSGSAAAAAAASVPETTRASATEDFSKEQDGDDHDESEEVAPLAIALAAPRSTKKRPRFKAKKGPNKTKATNARKRP